MPNTHIVIFSSYPDKGIVHDEKIVGGAAYTKKLLLSLKQAKPDLDLTVYAECFAGRAAASYDDSGISVKRLWKRNHFGSIWKAVRSIAREQADTVAVSYEINMVGNPAANMFFLIALLSLKLQGKRIVFIPHQVVGSFAEMEKSRIKSCLLDTFKRILFFYICALADRVIVFEARLASYLPMAGKVRVVPLAVEEGTGITKQEARQKLGLRQEDFIVLYFGFLSPYKGVDSLLAAYRPEMGTLIIAGDGNPNHMGTPSYRSYVGSVKEAARAKGALAPGFIPEELIPAYFAACDLVVLPYRMFFSSSYPLAFAFSYGKPFLLSRALQGYFNSDDFVASARETGLDASRFVFDCNSGDLAGKINGLRRDYDRFSRFARSMKSRRSWPVIAGKYLEIFNIM